MFLALTAIANFIANNDKVGRAGLNAGMPSRESSPNKDVENKRIRIRNRSRFS